MHVLEDLPSIKKSFTMLTNKCGDIMLCLMHYSDVHVHTYTKNNLNAYSEMNINFQACRQLRFFTAMLLPS